MAYMNQERKKELAPWIKEVLKKYNIKWTISVQSSLSLVVNIREGYIDFFNNYKWNLDGRDYLQVNTYYINDNFSWEAKDFLEELNKAMNVGNHDNSDPMTDYFDVGWYTDINIWTWENPYVLKK